MTFDPMFDLVLTLPRDVRFAATAAAVAAHAARQAGYAAPVAEAFGRRVEECVRESLEAPGAPPLLPVVVRREDGPIHVIIDGRTLILE